MQNPPAIPEIWLVEDNAAFRGAIQYALRKKPDLYSSKGFESCEAALAAISKGEKPNLILLDVGLPGMDGIQGIQHFKNALPEVIILILTVFENDDKIFQAICAGASGYLLKSEPVRDIVLSLDHALAGGVPMNPRIAHRVLAMFSKLAPVKNDHGLTIKEQRVLQEMVNGLAKKQIADELKISVHTVNAFVRSIYKKLHVNCQTAAVSIAVRDGLAK